MPRYLEGPNVKPHCGSDARKLIGKRVMYLRNCDIDKSGRGYYFPQTGIIAEVRGKNIAIDVPGNFVIHARELVEMVLLEEP